MVAAMAEVVVHDCGCAACRAEVAGWGDLVACPGCGESLARASP